MKTKERILEEALKLFSEKGFHAVSVRDIAQKVGIKDSSLYNHFKSKQEIFDTIVESCYQKAKNYFREQKLPFEISDDNSMYHNATLEQLNSLILKTFGYFFENEYNIMFRKLLLLSQFENKRAKQIYRRLYKEYPIEFQSHLFADLMNYGELKRGDPEVLARDFYGVIFMLLHTCDSLEEAKPQILSHINQFLKNYKKEGNKI